MPASAGSRLAPPTFISDSVAHRRALTHWAASVHQGHLGNTGEVTLAAGTANTAVADARVGPGSVIQFMPLTLNAAEALAGVYVINRTAEAFTIAHANTTTADRAFAYSILG